MKTLLVIIFYLCILTVLFIVISALIKSRIFNAPKRSQVIFLNYLLILIISVGVFYLLPREGYLDSVFYVDSDEEFIYLDKIPKSQVADNLGQLHLIGQKEFKYFGESIKINIPKSEADYMYLIFSRKTVDDGIIEVSAYADRAIMANIDYTSQLSPDRITFDNGGLFIMKSSKEARFNCFQSDFTVNQFKNSSIKLFYDEKEIRHYPMKLLYVRLPKSVEVNMDESHFGYADIIYINQ